ncbi:SAM-dependent methyltransferase [Streptomyces sp. B1866]|uniref:SAM-dependent methyltransferase n=1 Tax=Streptomyces sp. B1866 TaxID=3075431 RepID=UPI00288E8497|nr:SAM-dependent methyltransferase [Streptomyces sp. B1866]MDT3397280.1 SAM-dependent methyltransferase [Streptomyces sp. B1866]
MTDSPTTSSAPQAEGDAEIDTTVPQSPRIWNYWMGGTDNYEVDRRIGDAYRAAAPSIEVMARASRVYLIRTVTFLARECGVRQFLEIGPGLPTYDSTHEVLRREAPGARVVYVDKDPLVLRRVRAAREADPETVAGCVAADLHEPDAILEAVRGPLDFDQPVALVLAGILGHIQDFDESLSIVRRLLAPLPSGSYFLHYEGTDTEQSLGDGQAIYEGTGAEPYVMRTPGQLARYYDGLDLVEPGIVSCPLWRPEPGESPEVVDIYGGVARKP